MRLLTNKKKKNPVSYMNLRVLSKISLYKCRLHIRRICILCADLQIFLYWNQIFFLILIWIINSHIFFRLIIYIESWSTNSVVIWAPIKLSLILGVNFQFFRNKGLYLLAQISKVISQFHVPRYIEFWEEKKKKGWLWLWILFFFFWEKTMNLNMIC